MRHRTATSTIAKTPAYYVYGANLPPYFTIDPVQAAAVASTKATLESFYGKRSAQTGDSYLAGFDSTMASVQSQFP